MSVKVMTLAWAVVLPHSAKLVLLALADNANDEGDCWPSIPTLASKCCMHRSTVMRMLGELEERRHITRSMETGKTNLYRVHPLQPATGPTAESEVDPSQSATSRILRPVAQSDPTRRSLRPPPVAACDPTRRSLRPRNVMEPSIEPSGNRQRARARVSRETDPDWLLDFKLAYPDRAGDQGWRRAVRAGSARLAEGHTTAEMIAGAERYAAFVDATGKRGTEYVKQAATFLGPDKPFLLPWTLPAKPETDTERLLRLNSARHDDRVIEHEPEIPAIAQR